MTTLDSASVPAAVLWDMDGTLVDTEPYWMASEVELVRSFGGNWTHDDGLMLVGSGLWNSASILQSRGVDMTQDSIVAWLTDRVQGLIDTQGVPWCPGALSLLGQIRDAGIPTALVTMSVRRMAEKVVDRVPFAAFDTIISGDEVEFAKPHPDPYLRAASTLGVDISASVALEDSLAGLTSAVASGAITVGIPRYIPLPESAEHTLWETLEGRELTDVTDLVAARRASR